MISEQVYLLSPAGFPNMGDEWIAHIRISNLLQNPDVYKIYLDCQNPDEFLRLFPFYKTSPRVEVCSIAWSWLRELASGGLWEGLIELERVFNSGRFNSVASYSWISRSNDESFSPTLIEVLGGGFVNDLWPCNGLLLRMLGQLKVQYRAKLKWTNGSIHPASSTFIFDLGTVLSAFDEVTTRDTFTAELIYPYINKVQLGKDAVMDDLCSLKPILRSAKKVSARPHAYINLARDLMAVDDFSVRFNWLVKEIRALQESHELIYLLANPVADILAWERLKIIYPSIVLWSLDDILNLTCKSGWDLPCESVAFSNRFHVRMYLAFFGVKGYFWPNGSYYSNKHDILDHENRLTPWVNVNSNLA